MTLQILIKVIKSDGFDSYSFIITLVIHIIFIVFPYSVELGVISKEDNPFSKDVHF